MQEEINNANARINTLSSALNADSAIRAQRLADLNSKIEDLNKDNTPEIILEKNDGAKVVYDIKNNYVNFDFDGEKIEKIR